MILHSLVSFALAPVAFADLYAVGAATVEASYYRISLDDLSVEHVTTNSDEFFIWELARGPDDRYYGIDLCGNIQRNDPLTGEEEDLFAIFAQVFPAGSLALTADDMLYATSTGFGFRLYRLDTTDDSYDFISLSQDWTIGALHERSDGLLVGARWQTNEAVSLEPATATLEEIGTFTGVTGSIASFAEDPSGQTYLLSVQAGGVAHLHTVDLFTFEASLIGALPGKFELAGIAWEAPACIADFNDDGDLNVLDFVTFQLAWQAGDGKADINGDGELDALDFVAFQGLFQDGCP